MDVLRISLSGEGALVLGTSANIYFIIIIRGLVMKNWKKEIVCIMYVCNRGLNFCGLPFCLVVCQLLSAASTNQCQIFRVYWESYWLCIFQTLAQYIVSIVKKP